MSRVIELVRARVGPDVTEQLLNSVGTDDTLIVTGSVIEGIGNERSDIDAFVISDARRRGAVQMAFAGESWIDIEYFRPAFVHELVQKFRDVDPADLGQVLTLTRKDFDRYYRMATGVVLRGSPDWPGMFDLAEFRPRLRAWSMAGSGAYAARADCALKAGRTTDAVLFADKAAHLYAMGVLSDAGQLYPSLKYALEKAQRANAAGPASVTAIESLLFAAEEPRGHVSRVVEQIAAELKTWLPTCRQDGLAVEPVRDIAHDWGEVALTVMTRKFACDVVRDDAQVVGELLDIPELRDVVDGRTDHAVLRTTHHSALQHALLEAGFLKEVGHGCRV